MSLPCDHMIEEVVKYQCCPKTILRCVKTDEPRCPFCPKHGAAAEPVKPTSEKWMAPKPEPEPEAPAPIEKMVMIPDPEPKPKRTFFKAKEKPAPAEQEPASEPEDEPDSDVE